MSRPGVPWRSSTPTAGCARSGSRTSPSRRCDACSTKRASSPPSTRSNCSPELAQSELRAFHTEHGIATEAWSPLGSGKGLLDHPLLARLGAKHGRTPAQIVLRWHVQIGNVVIPKSVTPSRIAENIKIFDFSLDDEDLAAIATLDSGRRIGPDPASFNWMG